MLFDLMRSNLVLACSAALTLMACGGQDEQSSETPARFSVERGFLRGADGRALVLRGVNLANAHKQAPYFGFHRPGDFARLRDDWGMNHVRFLLSWAAIEPERDVFDDAYLDAVAERMDWALQAGLFVVLDMHQDLYGEGFGGDGAPRWTCDESHYAAYTPVQPWFINYTDPEVIACIDAFFASDELTTSYVEAWGRVAQKLGKHSAVLGFDPMNEPYWGSYPSTDFELDVLQPFYQRIAERVRAEAPDWVAFFEPFAGRNLGFPNRFEPFELPAVVYSPHAYDASAEQGTGFDPSSRAAFMARFQKLKEEADALGAALWIGEYGGTSSLPGIEAYVDAAYDGAASVSAGSAYWSYDRDSGYGLLDESGNEKTHVLDQIVRPYPEWVAGDPIDFEWDESTRRFSVRYTSSAKITAATEIAVPPRSYPNGYKVTCDGCQTEIEPGRLVVRRPPLGDPATLVLEP